jgi:tetratricopeptide (TPR) repeat protein
VPLLVGFDPFRSANEDVEQGNAKLGAKKYKQALEHYDSAAKELPEEPGVHYNRGIALHRLGRHKEAAEALGKATTARDRNLKSKSFFNLGNVLLEQKRYKEAAEAYKGALRLKPGHRPSKWNLELALRQIQKKKKEEEKKKQQKKQKKDQQKDQQDQQNQQDKQNQQQKDQKQQQQGDKKKQKQQDQQQGDKKKQQPQPSRKKQQPKPKPSRRQMDSVLDALDRSDKNLQKRRARMRRGQGFHRPSKDW